MTQATCVMCGAEARPALQASDRNRRLSAETFDYYRCTSCETLALRPVPADLDRYYTAVYYAVPSERAALVRASGAEQYKLELIRRFVPGGRLVEIGPAVGGFSALMQDAGYDTSAIEMDAECCRFLRDVVGIPVQETDDPVAGLAATGPVDVIALWHVIEHLANPAELVEAAAASLRPGGVLALAAPNPESFQFRLLGRRWTHLDAPRHLVLAPAGTYVEIGRRHGLELVLRTARDEGTLHWNEFGWAESMAGFATNRYVRHALRLTGRLLTRGLAVLDRRPGNGSTYTLILRKPPGSPTATG